MYAKINNGLVEKYPYTIGELRRDNPQISFPFQIPPEVLEEHGVVRVEETDAPTVDATQELIKQEPQYVDGRWIQTWSVRDKTPEEIESLRQIKADEVRMSRNSMLSSSDWTQAKDIDDSVSSLWVPYRQQLRDITEQPGFPFNINWPVAPTDNQE